MFSGRKIMVLPDAIPLELARLYIGSDVEIVRPELLPIVFERSGTIARDSQVNHFRLDDEGPRNRHERRKAKKLKGVR